MPTNFPRRQFLRTSVLTTAAAATASHTHAVPRQKLALGYDNFAVRAMGWKAPQLIDYTVELKVDTLFITDLDAFESLEENALTEIGKLAEEKGIQLYLGTWSICPTSVTFKDKWGTADEHLQIGIRAAEALKSPSLRVVLGNGKDRLSEGGIDARIDDTVAVLQRNKSIAVDAGIKIGMENHAGDMHSLELVRLIEDAGTDFVGANVDSGNAVWTLEDPVENLRNLAPYALTTSLRDTAIWESENGFTAQWTAMGEGTTDLKTYFELFASECPDVPVNIETISGFNRELPTKSDDFWKAWPKGKPKGYEKFVELAKRGTPREAWKAPEGVDKKKAQKEYQRGEIERSLQHCRKALGLGIGAA